MTKRINLKTGGAIEVRIEDGQIAEAAYTHNSVVAAKRQEKDQIKFFMKQILDDDVEEFKAILTMIKNDEEYFSYGKGLLDAKREVKVRRLIDYRKECEKMLSQLQADVDRFTLPK